MILIRFYLEFYTTANRKVRVGGMSKSNIRKINLYLKTNGNSCVQKYFFLLLVLFLVRKSNFLDTDNLSNKIYVCNCTLKSSERINFYHL